MLFFSTVLATILKQTPASSTIEFTVPTAIRVPPHTYVTGYLHAEHPFYLVQRAVIHKPVRKFFDYDYNAERGIVIDAEDGRAIGDSLVVGDFSACYVGIASAGVFIALLLKLFG